MQNYQRVKCAEKTQHKAASRVRFVQKPQQTLTNTGLLGHSPQTCSDDHGYPTESQIGSSKNAGFPGHHRYQYSMGLPGS